MSNVKHFGDIDPQLLPNMIEAVQNYGNMLIREAKDFQFSPIWMNSVRSDA